jgi:hypothetical protein
MISSRGAARALLAGPMAASAYPLWVARELAYGVYAAFGGIVLVILFFYR